MNREPIEANDLRLLKQFREIAHSKKEKKRGSRAFPIMTICGLVMIGILSAVGILCLRSESVERSVATTVAMPIEEESCQKDGLFAPPLASSPSMTGKKNETDKPVPMVSSVPAPFPHVKGKTTSDKATETVKNKVIPVKKTSHPLPAVAQHPGVSIGEIVTCCSVKNRQYVNASHGFSLKDSPTPTVWMSVEAADPPFTLTHVYYVNGEKYCSVPLGIRYHRTRTWSRVKATTRAHLGAWRVDVVTDDGHIVGRTTFDVLP